MGCSEPVTACSPRTFYSPLFNNNMPCWVFLCSWSAPNNVVSVADASLKYSAAADGLQLGSIILGATLSIPAISFTAASTITIVDFNTVTITVGRSQCVV